VSLREELRALQRELGITAIFVTHDQEEALALSHRVVVMSEGRVEQVGTPAEVYHTPLTPFVATFVGLANVLACRVVDPETGAVALGDAHIATGRVLKERLAGGMVRLGLRPEAISLEPLEGAGNRLTGEVREVSFLGPVARLRLALPGEVGMLVDVHGDACRRLPEAGIQVSLHFRSDSLQVLEAQA
jgi:putative spermidine/putrescine transport system ATP-binding protein